MAETIVNGFGDIDCHLVPKVAFLIDDLVDIHDESYRPPDQIR